MSEVRRLLEDRRLELMRRADGAAVLVLSGEAPFERRLLGSIDIGRPDSRRSSRS